MQLSAISLALTRAGMVSAFSPLGLFSSGSQGIWYDPSDLSTLYEDAAGTTPITSPLEKPVGLMLDKSKGLVLGPELVTNGDFSNGTTGWTLVTATVSDAQVTIQANGNITQPVIPLETGRWFKITFTIVSTAGAVNVYCGTNSSGDARYAAAFTSTGLKTLLLQSAGSVNTVKFGSNAAGVSILDNISVRELPGNHATQSTTTSRPTLSARYNLLTKTEDFGDAAWVKNVPLSVVSKTEIAPDGTASATRVTSATAANIYQVIQNSVGQTFKVWVKSATATNQTFLMFGNRNQYFTKTATTSWQLFECSPSLIGSDGWWGLQLGSSVPNDLLIWHPDIRPANDGVGLPAYQRVNTASDYDYAGFPPYLKFDGTDDGMATGNIDFTATDKMSVFAGVRKLSASALGFAMAELSANVTTNSGSFLFTPETGGANAPGFYSRGTSGTYAEGSAALPPITQVLSGIGNISGDSAILRVNGTQAASSTADQGTGNYGNYPLYIGRRGGSSLPFNGRLYSLIVCGKTASASEITATEAYINNRTRAY